MKVIIGLGNPGEKYENTRHNAGFMFLDFLKKYWDFPEFEFNKKFNAEISTGNIRDVKTILAKPQTFMNLSGTSAQTILDFYKLSPADIIVIHDDLDIETGKYKVAADSSSAGHNGVENIIEKLGTQKFKRIRIGTGKTLEEKESCLTDAHEYVLQNFSKEKKETIEKLFPEIEAEIKKLL
jgi:peptidyl-tRNA hydrolase, PTH1 family